MFCYRIVAVGFHTAAAAAAATTEDNRFFIVRVCIQRARGGGGCTPYAGGRYILIRREYE